jgi:hypothetical protein
LQNWHITNFKKTKTKVDEHIKSHCTHSTKFEIFLIRPLKFYKMLLRLVAGFSFSILWGRWTGNHSQENTAKFGYRSERKVGKFWSSQYFGNMIDPKV